MEKPAFSRACLSGVRVIMVIMHIPVVELLCKAVMGRPPVLKYLLLGTHELDHGKRSWSEGPNHGGRQPPSRPSGASVHAGGCLG
jgi:hypothetical protein